jgi:hypothetical protein
MADVTALACCKEHNLTESANDRPQKYDCAAHRRTTNPHNGATPLPQFGLLPDQPGCSVKNGHIDRDGCANVLSRETVLPCIIDL